MYTHAHCVLIIQCHDIVSEPRIHEVQEAVLYVILCVCGLWGDHFSEETVKF